MTPPAKIPNRLKERGSRETAMPLSAALRKPMVFLVVPHHPTPLLHTE